MLQPERQFDAEKMRASFDFHREHPDISFESHIREKRIALGDSISSLDPIYLDTRFWIFIRDAALGSPKQAAHVDLLSVLRSAVQSKKAFCPLSGASYIELLRQAEPEKRNAIASLVDELSLGITFAAEEERAIAELANFLYSPIFPSQLHPLRSLIWNRLPYVLGVMSPSFEWLVPAETLVAKKAFFDHLWDFSLADMVSAIQPGNPLTQLPLEELAIRLNALNQKYSGELKSYKQTYKREVWGAIQPLIPHAKEIGDAILDQMAARGLGKSDRASPSEIERKFKDSLLEVAEKSTLSKIRFIRLQHG